MNNEKIKIKISKKETKNNKRNQNIIVTICKNLKLKNILTILISWLMFTTIAVCL